MMVPVLETERLRLRRHEVGDFEASLTMWTHPTTYRFIGGKPSTRSDCWARMLRHIGQWELLGYGTWLVERRDTGAFVGEIGFLNAQRDIDQPFGDTPELGWGLAPDAHGQGYAEESVRAALAWGDPQFPRTVCMIDPENTASHKLAAKLGYRPYGETLFKDEPIILLERFA